MKNIIIRTSKRSDLIVWAELRDQLWPNQQKAHERQLSEYFDGKSNDIVQVYFAETSDGELVGFIELNLRNFAEGSRSKFVPYIEGWLVKESFRHLGIGKQLIAKAEAWSQECGFKELASDAELENENSIAIHKRLGFKEVERVVCFIKQF